MDKNEFDQLKVGDRITMYSTEFIVKQIGQFFFEKELTFKSVNVRNSYQMNVSIRDEESIRKMKRKERDDAST